MTDNETFEAQFSATLDNAAGWIIDDSLTKYGEFGELFSQVRFMLQRTVLPAAMLGTHQRNGFLKGVHLKQISVPEMRRRRRYATRVLDRLLQETKKAGLKYLFVESVMSDEMHALMRGRTEFRAVEQQPNCYVAVFTE